MSGSTTTLPEDIVNIYLLGPPEVTWAGETLSIPRRHVRGLLYHLAAQKTPSSRDNLCLLFWPDVPEANARRNLTRALTHLRRALPAPAMLVVDGESVHLDRRFSWCDAIEFKDLIQTGADTDNIQQAIDLYRGPFLDGFHIPGCLEFERWMSQERTALENIYLGALSRLIETSFARQDYANAVHYSQRYLQTDDLAEEVHCRLISLYALSGDRSKALRQYEVCVSILERELGTRPLPETRAVYEALLEGNLADLQRKQLETVSLLPARHPPQETPLVGRSVPIRHLAEGVQKVDSGQSKVILISGEPGIGKSRLLAEFAGHCRPSSQVLLGAGQPAERSVPYHPIVEALRSGQVYAPASLPPIWCAEVARILPELYSQYPNLPPPISLKGEEARIRLFEALCRYIFALQADSRVILLGFDDMHWFDQTSLSWLVYLCRQIATQNSRVMVVGTYRSEDSQRVNGLRDNLARLGILDEVNLEGIDEPGIIEITRQMFKDIPISGTFASRLRETTGGNPFFILETLWALPEKGEFGSVPDDLAGFPLPDSVREAVNRRLGRLNPRARQVLEAGAVLGQTFDFKTVQFTAGRSEPETSSALELLVDRQLITEGYEHYHFSHDLVRRVAISAIGPMRLRLLHARAGKALEKLQPESLTALAEHFDAACEWSKSLHYHDLSTTQAEALFAWQEAESHLERSLQILSFLDADSPGPENLARHFQTLSKLTRLHSLMGKLELRDADLQRLQKLAVISNDPQSELQTLLLEVQNLNSDAHYQDAISTAEKGLALADRLEERSTHSRLLAQIGLSYNMLGQPAQALSALQEVSSEVDESGDDALRTLVLGNMAQVYRVLGDYRHALGCLQEAYDISRELGDPYGAARYVDIGYLYANLGRFQEAHKFLAECLAAARKIDIRNYEAHAQLAIGGTCLFQGYPIPAIEHCHAALEILKGLRSENLSASAAATIGFAYYKLGDLDQGRKWLTRGLDIAQSIGHRMRAAQILFQLVLLEIAACQISAADSKVHEGSAIAREIRSVELISVGLAIAARLERLSGTPDKARGYAQEALHYAQRHGLTAVEVLARVESALALVDLGKLSSAAGYTNRAVSLIPRAHQLWIGAEQVHQAHARVLERMGQMQIAQEHECIAAAIRQDKAGHIPDPAQRAVFLANSRLEY